MVWVRLMHQCHHCKQTLPIAFFNKHKNKPKGLDNCCYVCHKARRIHLRGRHRGRVETITIKECWDIYNLFEGRCFRCNSKERITFDHHNNSKPISINNCVVLCNQCNASKRQKKPSEFYSATQLNQLVFHYEIEPI